MSDTTEATPPEDTFDPQPISFNLAMPEKVPVVMSAEGVGGMFEATREFIREALRPEIGTIETPTSEIGVMLKPGGTLDRIPRDWIEEAEGRPLFRRGTASLTSLTSFIDHVNRFGDEDSVVFVNDSASPALTAVLDYHRADRLASEDDDAEGLRVHGAYRFGKHCSKFAFPLSEEWLAWTAADGELMSMVDFAAFVEKRAGDIDAFDDGAIPESLERFVTVNGGSKRIASFGQLLELSKGLKVSEDSVIEEAVTLSSGEGQVKFSNAHNTSVAGVAVKVPTMFFIAIPVFNRGAYYRIGVALRYRKSGSKLVFWLELNRPDISLRHALDEAVERVAQETPAQVLFGSPEA